MSPPCTDGSTWNQRICHNCGKSSAERLKRLGDLNVATRLAELKHGTTDVRRTAANYDVRAECHLTAAGRDSALNGVPTTLLVILVVGLIVRIVILMLYGN